MKGRVRTLAVVLAVIGISAAAVLGATATTNRSAASRQQSRRALPCRSGPTNVRATAQRQARHLSDLRQRAFPAGQPERPVGPRADAAPAELHPRQRHAAHERPHGPDLAHRERDPHHADRRLPRPHGPAGVELLPLLQARRLEPRPSSSFKYWTDLTDDVNTPPTDANYRNDQREAAKNAPAPWVPFTRAGCDVGRDRAREHRAREHRHRPDRRHDQGLRHRLARVERGRRVERGPGRHAARTSRRPTSSASASTAHRPRRVCGATRTPRRTRCPTSRAATPASRALFGAKYVNPVISRRRAPMRQRTPRKATPDQRPVGHRGFPGFDGMFATTTLSLRRADAGVRDPGHVRLHLGRPRPARRLPGASTSRTRPARPATSSSCTTTTSPSSQFFDRLAADGINKSNTLFVFTVDEGDHFAGSQPEQPGCDGVTVAVRLRHEPGRRDQRQPAAACSRRSTATTRRSPSTPTMRRTSTSTGNPARTDRGRRGTSSGRWPAAAGLNPYTGADADDIMVALADQVEDEDAAHGHRRSAADADLHAVRRSGLVLLRSRRRATTCATHAACASIPRADEPELRVEPRRHPGRDRHRPGPATSGRASRTSATTDSVWTDHTDHRPTHADAARPEGRLPDRRPGGRREIADENALPVSLRVHHPSVEQLAASYKQLMASFGTFSMDTLTASTHALVEQLGRRRDLQRHRKPDRVAHEPAQRARRRRSGPALNSGASSTASS